jgi:hypothetical protein
MKPRKRSIAAFSLVELSIALGVIVFCLLVIMGLLAVGTSSTHSSAVQTSATNILTAVISDLEAVPNITPSYGLTTAKGTVAQPSRSSGSPVYGLYFPAGGAGATSTYKFYVGENGLTNSSAAASLYQVNIWMTASSTTSARQETFARVLITWPATVSYANAQGYVEGVIAINRT